MLCSCWPVQSLFLFPPFIIYKHNSIVICCGATFSQRCSHVHWEGEKKTYFHCSRQECALTHTRAQISHKDAYLTLAPPLSVTTTPATFRDTNGQGFPSSLHMLYPFLTLVFWFAFISSFSSATCCLQCQSKVTSSFSIFSRNTDTHTPRHSMYRVLPGCPYLISLSKE